MQWIDFISSIALVMTGPVNGNMVWHDFSYYMVFIHTKHVYSVLFKRCRLYITRYTHSALLVFYSPQVQSLWCLTLRAKLLFEKVYKKICAELQNVRLMGSIPLDNNFYCSRNWIHWVSSSVESSNVYESHQSVSTLDACIRVHFVYVNGIKI